MPNTCSFEFTDDWIAGNEKPESNVLMVITECPTSAQALSRFLGQKNELGPTPTTSFAQKMPSQYAKFRQTFRAKRIDWFILNTAGCFGGGQAPAPATTVEHCK